MKGLEHAIKPTGWPTNSFKEAYCGGGGTVPKIVLPKPQNFKNKHINP